MRTGSNARTTEKSAARTLIKAFKVSSSRRGFICAGGAGLAACATGDSQAAAAAADETQFEISGCQSDVIADDHIWISGALTDVGDGLTLQDGDVVSCYDPAGDSTESVITYFEIECTGSYDDPTEPEMVYEETESEEVYFEIDLSILESFEENYDPDAGGTTPDDSAYTMEDPEGGSIGING